MSIVERDLYPPFSKWIRDNTKDIDKTAVFELKITKTNRFNKNNIAPHQLRNLRMSTTPTGVYWKAPDEGISQKPFDSMLIKNAYALLVICYMKTCYAIDIHAWDQYMNDKISITAPECEDIAWRKIIL